MMNAVDQIRDAIVHREREIAGLKTALAILEGTTTVAETPPGKAPAPRPASTGAEVTGSVASVAKYLRDNGPQRFGDLQDRLGMSQPTLSHSLKNNASLFTKVEPANRLSEWTLTETGKAAARSL